MQSLMQTNMKANVMIGGRFSLTALEFCMRSTLQCKIQRYYRFPRTVSFHKRKQPCLETSHHTTRKVGGDTLLLALTTTFRHQL